MQLRLPRDRSKRVRGLIHWYPPILIRTAIYLGDRKPDRDAVANRNIAGNGLVLIAPADSNARIDIVDGLDLRGALGDGRLAIADPDIVPAGRYAKAVREALHGWSGVSDRLARAENVWVALAYVVRRGRGSSRRRVRN